MYIVGTVGYVRIQKDLVRWQAAFCEGQHCMVRYRIAMYCKSERIRQATYWEGRHAESAPPSLHIAPSYPTHLHWPIPTTYTGRCPPAANPKPVPLGTIASRKLLPFDVKDSLAHFPLIQFSIFFYIPFLLKLHLPSFPFLLLFSPFHLYPLLTPP